MILQSLVWRRFTRDKIFLGLLGLALLTSITALLSRESAIERTSVPFNLGVLFSIVNVLFAMVTLRREPLLSYMFLTATIIINGTLYFFFRYLALTLAN